MDRAEQLEGRKWIFGQKFPQTAKPGPKPAISENFSSFADDTADKTGQTARTIQADVAIAKGIPAKLRDDIRGTDMENSRADLRALARAKARLTPRVPQATRGRGAGLSICRRVLSFWALCRGI